LFRISFSNKFDKKKLKFQTKFLEKICEQLKKLFWRFLSIKNFELNKLSSSPSMSINIEQENFVNECKKWERKWENFARAREKKFSSEKLKFSLWIFSNRGSIEQLTSVGEKIAYRWWKKIIKGQFLIIWTIKVKWDEFKAQTVKKMFWDYERSLREFQKWTSRVLFFAILFSALQLWWEIFISMGEKI
jgi:hypothetical protein